MHDDRVKMMDRNCPHPRHKEAEQSQILFTLSAAARFDWRNSSTLSWLQQLTCISNSSGKSYTFLPHGTGLHTWLHRSASTHCWTWTRGCERKEAFWEERGAQSCEDIECFLVKYWEVVSGGCDYRELILICQVSHEQTIDEGDATQRSWCSFLHRRGKNTTKNDTKYILFA